MTFLASPGAKSPFHSVLTQGLCKQIYAPSYSFWKQCFKACISSFSSRLCSLKACLQESGISLPTLPLKWLLLKPGQRLDYQAWLKALPESSLAACPHAPGSLHPNQTRQLLRKSLGGGRHLCFTAEFS